MLSKKYCFLIFFSIVLFTINANAEILNSADENNTELEKNIVSPFSFAFGTDLVTRYVWRGVEFGVDQNGSSTPHIQPTASLTYSYLNNSISLGFWGSYGFSGNYSESDLYLNLYFPTEILDLSFTFNDYYYPYLGIPFTNFEDNGAGAHTVDAQLGITLNSYLPINFLISKNIYNDVPENNSLYLELGYSFEISNTSIGLFAGAAKGYSIWHSVSTDKYEFVNVGFKVGKSVKITEDFSLPLNMQWIYNHHLKKTYLVFKVTL